MSKYISHMLLLTVAALFAVACSDDESGGGEVDNRIKLSLLMNMPQSTRAMSDPGQSTNEDENWNRVVVAVVYPEGTGNNAGIPAHHRVTVAYWSKDDFENLPPLYEGVEGSPRKLDVSCYMGEAYVYAFAYYHDETDPASVQLFNDLIAAREPADGDTKSAVENLRISNDYALGKEDRISRFLSVASGYYRSQSFNSSTGSWTQSSEVPQLLTIGLPVDGDTPTYLPLIRLSRLATKLDIQWDVAEEYPNNVLLSEFKFNGRGTEAATSGFGRLYPELYAKKVDEGSVTSNSIGGTTTFINTTAISQRNGRVYHYLFPDGTASTPTMTFTLTAPLTGEATDNTKSYTLQFPAEHSRLNPATWYKVNATVRGNTGDAETIVLTVRN